jgi:hypothetical protein
LFKELGDVNMLSEKWVRGWFHTLPKTISINLLFRCIDVINEIHIENPVIMDIDDVLANANADLTWALNAEEEIDYQWKFVDFKWKIIQGWWTVHWLLQDSRVKEQNWVLTLMQWVDVIATIPSKENTAFQWKSWSNLAWHFWNDDGIIKRVTWISLFEDIISWCDEVNLSNSTLRANFFREVLGLKNWYYLCAEEADSEYAHAIEISEWEVRFVTIDKTELDSNYHVLTN